MPIDELGRRRFLQLSGVGAAAVLGDGLFPAAQAAAPAAAAAACVDNPFGSRPLYLRGGFNGWSASSDYQFAYNCNRFELMVNLTGSSDFKIADANWSPDADFGGGAAGDLVQPGVPLQLALQGANLTYAFDGDQKVVLDISQSSTTPSVTITSCLPNPLGKALLGLSGDFNGFNPRPADYFLYSCDGYYLNVDLQGTYEFTIIDPIGAPGTHLGAADDSHNGVSLNHRLMRRGADLEELARLLGHQRLDTTRRYLDNIATATRTR